MSKPPLLEVRNLTKVFKIGGLILGSRLTAVDNVDFTLEAEEAEVLSLVGESGSGKTTLGRMILGFLEPTSGAVLHRGRNLFKLKGEDKKNFRQDVQPIFQNPFESFNPLKRVDTYLLATARNYGFARSNTEAHEVISEALGVVGLEFKEIEGKYPHEFSGGELQRVSVARALVTSPSLLVADEPVSMVDASIRMAIINLFLELKRGAKMSCLYITHDLATAYYISDEVAIMYRGGIVEYGKAEEVLTDPLHPYTKILLECVPDPDPEKRWSREIKLSGLEVKEFEALGCKFANRCPSSESICSKRKPKDTKVGGRTVKCWLFKN